MRIGLIFGGPSDERGISLNSARTVMDHLKPLGWKIFLYYCDRDKHFHRFNNKAQLYSNTPLDFDFKLDQIAKPLDEDEFIRVCKETDLIDIIFPVIHGVFGEDGELQKLLEKHKIPFVGSSSNSCIRMFDKVKAKREMEENGFTTLPDCCFEDVNDISLGKVNNFFEYILDDDFFEKKTDNEVFEHENYKKFVVKPSAGGSSIGVKTVTMPEKAVEHAEYIFSKNLGGCAMIEPYCKGREFTVIVLENKTGKPVALIPTEIRLFGGDIFTYRTKYLPSRHVEYHCPPRFNDTVIRRIQKSAEKLFELFDMKDFVRIDGWLLKDGSLIFSDFNPISGMEQNSDMFLQGSRVGFSHCEMLKYIVTCAMWRAHPSENDKPKIRKKLKVVKLKRKPDARKIRVLFGGETSERQVSLMSGTNVWLKLLYDERYDPSPYLLTPDHDIWKLPYSFTLNYTVEEILSNCNNAEKITGRLRTHVGKIVNRLEVSHLQSNAYQEPIPIKLDNFCTSAKRNDEFIFIALHGGYGECGDLQARLKVSKLAYNGSDENASRLCMDKFETGKSIKKISDDKLFSANKVLIEADTGEQVEDIWKRACSELNIKNDKIIIKPRADGCSTGVVRLESPDDLRKYLRAISQGQKALSWKTRPDHYSIIELPPKKVSELILEPYYQVDKLEVKYYEVIIRVDTDEQEEDIWKRACSELNIKNDKIIIKSRASEFSTSVVLESPDDLRKYLRAVRQGQKALLWKTLSGHNSMIELPPKKVNELILKPYNKVDKWGAKYCDLVHTPNISEDGGWIELTVGVLKDNESYQVMTPSITIVDEMVLSVEDKFQGGTGVNVTPPREDIINKDQTMKIKENIKKVAEELEIQGYARIDIFFNRNTDKMIIIEANSLPGLSPSTVIFQQACLENLSPQKFLVKLIDFGIKCHKVNHRAEILPM